MKKVVAFLLVASMALMLFAFDPKTSDSYFYLENDYEKDFRYLEECLKVATGDSEKAEILWRMSRARLSLTDEGKENKGDAELLKGYGDYGADDKPKADDTFSAFYYAYTSLKYKETANGYHWLSSAVGRCGQVHGALNSLGKAAPMRKLETKALEDFSDFQLQTDAWYVLSILYRSLPGAPISFGNDNYAISYMRKCLMTQDMENRTNGTNYLEMAEQLWKRGWDASKRQKEYKSMLKNWEKNQGKGATEYNKYYEAYLDTQGAPFWMSKTLSSVSDKEEAVMILEYGISVLEKRIPAATGLSREKKIEEKEKLEAQLKAWK